MGSVAFPAAASPESSTSSSDLLFFLGIVKMSFFFPRGIGSFLFLFDGVLQILPLGLKYFAKGEGLGERLVSLRAKLEVLQE